MTTFTGELGRTDDEAMVQMQAGSTVAFGVLHERYRGRAQRIARALCHDEGRAQEAVQEAFMSIWSTRCSYDERSAVAPWLLTVVRNRAIDNQRRNRLHLSRRADAELLETMTAHDDVLEQVVARDVAGHLSTALTQLPREQREVITLAFYDQLTHQEIAARLDLPLGTVKGRIRLGIGRLRGEIDRAIR